MKREDFVIVRKKKYFKSCKTMIKYNNCYNISCNNCPFDCDNVKAITTVTGCGQLLYTNEDKTVREVAEEFIDKFKGE